MRAKLVVVSALLTSACLLACFLYIGNVYGQCNCTGNGVTSNSCVPCCALGTCACPAAPQSNCIQCPCDINFQCTAGCFQYNQEAQNRPCCGGANQGTTGCDSNSTTNQNRFVCVTQTSCTGGPCMLNRNNGVVECQGPPQQGAVTTNTYVYVNPVQTGNKCPS
jgi:hypothetical protein